MVATLSALDTEDAGPLMVTSEGETLVNRYLAGMPSVNTGLTGTLAVTDVSTVQVTYEGVTNSTFTGPSGSATAGSTGTSAGTGYAALLSVTHSAVICPGRPPIWNISISQPLPEYRTVTESAEDDRRTIPLPTDTERGSLASTAKVSALMAMPHIRSPVIAARITLLLRSTAVSLVFMARRYESYGSPVLRILQ